MSKKWKKSGPAATPAKENKAVETKQDPTDVQSVICPKSAFPSQADAAKWCESRDYVVTAPGETADAFTFEQFPTKDCTSTPARKESLEGGAIAIVCQRRIEDGGGAVVPESSGMKHLDLKMAKPGTVRVTQEWLNDAIIDIEPHIKSVVESYLATHFRTQAKGFEDGSTDDPMQEERLPISIGLCRAVKELLDANVPLVDSPDMRAMFGQVFTCMQEAALATFPTMDLAWLAPGWPQEPGTEAEAADDDGAGIDSEGEEEEIAGMIEDTGGGEEEDEDADPDDMEAKGDEGMEEGDGPDGGYLADEEEDAEPEEEASDADDEDEEDDKPGKKKPFGKSYWGDIAAEVAGLKNSVRMLTGRLD